MFAFAGCAPLRLIYLLLELCRQCRTSILAGPVELPGFWIFMYRVNPFTYVMEGFFSAQLLLAPVTYTASELVHFEAPSGISRGQYVDPYIAEKGGYLLDNSTSSCRFCGTANSNSFSANMNLGFENRWRNFGFMWAFCVFHIAAAAYAGTQEEGSGVNAQ